jgi:hypothetical protein
MGIGLVVVEDGRKLGCDRAGVLGAHDVVCNLSTDGGA